MVYQIWPQHPYLAVTGLVLVGMLLLYLLRRYAHSLLLQLADLTHRQLRLAARSCQLACQQLAGRNREVMAALQDELLQRQLERETSRLRQQVERDAVAFRRLERDINEQVTAISEDYEASTQVPPVEPKWTAAVDAIARLHDDDNDEVMARILRDIHNTIQQQQREAMREYRWTVNTRHKLLAGLRPYWRKLGKLVSRFSGKSDRLLKRAEHVDRLVTRYEALHADSNAVTTSSVVTRFVIAGLFCCAGIAVGLMGFQLMLEPLTIILQGRTVLGLDMAPFVAAVHVGMVLTVAVFILEALHVTRMFPLLGGLDSRVRAVLISVGGVVLLALAGAQAGLANWQLPPAAATPVVETAHSAPADTAVGVDEAAGSGAAAGAGLAGNKGVDNVPVDNQPVDNVPADNEGASREQAGTGAGAMTAAMGQLPYQVLGVLGFTVPFILLLTIIALEYLLYTARPVTGGILLGAMRLVAAGLRLLGRLARESGRVAVRLYDVVIFLPLLIEHQWKRYRAEAAATGTAAPPSAYPATLQSQPQQGELAATTVTKVDFDAGRIKK